MLALKDIVQFLEPAQVKIPIQADELYLEKNLPEYVRDFVEKNMLGEQISEFQTLPPIPSNSFLIAFLYASDANFATLLEMARNEALSDLRKTLGYQLDEKDLHKKFNYTRKRRFKKVELQKKLFQVQKPLEEMYPDEEITNPIHQYIVDFFNINLLILDVNQCKVVPLFASLDNPDPFKPTFILFLEGKRFYPLVKTSGEYFILSQDNFLEKIYKKYTKLDPEAFKSYYSTIASTSTIDKKSVKKIISSTIESNNHAEDVNDNTDDEESDDNADNDADADDADADDADADDADADDADADDADADEINYQKLTLIELRKLATDKGISIWKKSEKSGNNIFKKKGELIEDLTV